MSNWEQVREIFADALETPPEDRGRFLDRTCTSDPELRLEVERLLADYEPASCLFQRIASTIGSFGSAPELEQGVVLANRFQIVRHLGSGGSADVYEVTDLELGERVALKRLRLGRITAEAEDRFRNEVRLARKIQSPHVCRVYDVGRTDIGRVETLFLTMELLDGETLRSRLRREGPLSEQAALPLLRQLASGLDAAHAIEILHRDFKSGNVILTQTGRGAVISDFGLALALETQTDSAVAAGTPAYMAPEQVEGKVLDRRADIYAFGVVMYEMVTGQLPFKGDTAAELARRRLSESPVPPRALRADLSERWERTILKCLSRKHVERFGSAGEVVAALNPLVGRRHVMAMALLSAAGIGTYVGGGLRSPSSEYSLAVLGFEAQQDLRYLAEALADDMAGVLSQIGSVKVLARASVMRLSEAQRSPAVMKELLGTSHVLTGKIRRLNGNRIRIVAELLNTAGSELAWSDSFEVSDGDVRRVGETICLAAMHSLRFRLPSAQVAAIETRHSKVPAALNSYLLGQYLAAKRDGPSLASSIEHYRNATTLDPQYALAYAGLGAAYTMITSKGIIARDEAFRQAEAMAVSDHLKT